MDKMNSIKNVTAFTLLELLVVIALLGVFSAIAYPNISNWITDREVRSEAYEFVAEINQVKSKVMSGEYALGMVHFTTPNFLNSWNFLRESLVIMNASK